MMSRRTALGGISSPMPTWAALPEDPNQSSSDSRSNSDDELDDQSLQDELEGDVNIEGKRKGISTAAERSAKRPRYYPPDEPSSATDRTDSSRGFEYRPKSTSHTTGPSLPHIPARQHVEPGSSKGPIPNQHQRNRPKAPQTFASQQPPSRLNILPQVSAHLAQPSVKERVPTDTGARISKPAVKPSAANDLSLPSSSKNFPSTSSSFVRTKTSKDKQPERNNAENARPMSRSGFFFPKRKQDASTAAKRNELMRSHAASNNNGASSSSGTKLPVGKAVNVPGVSSASGSKHPGVTEVKKEKAAQLHEIQSTSRSEILEITSDEDEAPLPGSRSKLRHVRRRTEPVIRTNPNTDEVIELMTSDENNRTKTTKSKSKRDHDRSQPKPRQSMPNLNQEIIVITDSDDEPMGLSYAPVVSPKLGPSAVAPAPAVSNAAPFYTSRRTASPSSEDVAIPEAKEELLPRATSSESAFRFPPSPSGSSASPSPVRVPTSPQTSPGGDAIMSDGVHHSPEPLPSKAIEHQLAKAAEIIPANTFISNNSNYQRRLSRRFQVASKSANKPPSRSEASITARNRTLSSSPTSHFSPSTGRTSKANTIPHKSVSGVSSVSHRITSRPSEGLVNAQKPASTISTKKILSSAFPTTPRAPKSGDPPVPPQDIDMRGLGEALNVDIPAPRKHPSTPKTSPRIKVSDSPGQGFLSNFHGSPSSRLGPASLTDVMNQAGRLNAPRSKQKYSKPFRYQGATVEEAIDLTVDGDDEQNNTEPDDLEKESKNGNMLIEFLASKKAKKANPRQTLLTSRPSPKPFSDTDEPALSRPSDLLTSVEQRLATPPAGPEPSQSPGSSLSNTPRQRVHPPATATVSLNSIRATREMVRGQKSSTQGLTLETSSPDISNSRPSSSASLSHPPSLPEDKPISMALTTLHISSNPSLDNISEPKPPASPTHSKSLPLPEPELPRSASANAPDDLHEKSPIAPVRNDLSTSKMVEDLQPENIPVEEGIFILPSLSRPKVVAAPEKSEKRRADDSDIEQDECENLLQYDDSTEPLLLAPSKIELPSAAEEPSSIETSLVEPVALESPPASPDLGGFASLTDEGEGIADDRRRDEPFDISDGHPETRRSSRIASSGDELTLLSDQDEGFLSAPVSIPSSRSPSPTNGEASKVAVKTYGGYPAITWKSLRSDIRNFTPKCYFAKDLPHSLQDHINAMSEITQQFEGMRDVFIAAAMENTADDEPDAPPLEIVNDVDHDATPKWEFYYTNKMWHGESVPRPDMKSLISCNCFGKCDPKSKTCACLKRQREVIGEGLNADFAYDNKGRLKHPGYPIYECNDLCGCGEECRNRVVQHGRKVAVKIAKTLNKGWGVFAGPKKIPSGTFIGIYSGELLNHEESVRRGHVYNKFGRTYLFDLDFYYLGGEVQYVVDAYHAGNFTRFLNHSCDPNARLYPCYINEGNIQKPLLVIFSRRDIEPDEEICFSYAGIYPGESDSSSEEEEEDEDADDPKKQDLIYGRCMCGAANCKGKRLFR